MKNNKKRTPKGHDAGRLIMDCIINSGIPEVEQYFKQVMKEEMNRAILNTPQADIEAMERAVSETLERATARLAWHFKDKLPPHMQQILEEQYPAPDVAEP